MLTKYLLHTPSVNYEINQSNLKNWDEIRVSYSRGAIDGVVRSFSSQFVFTEGARELLLGIYLRDGINADVKLEVRTINNDWTWSKVFECDLDFSTLSFDNTTLSINAIDNSLISLIKGNKGTKYEFLIGEDIKPDSKFLFDRIPMMENVSYELTQGSQFDNGDLQVTFNNTELPFIGNIGSEISLGQTVLYEDDQTNDSTSYILKALNDIEVTFEFSISYLNNIGHGAVDLYLYSGNKNEFNYSEGQRFTSLAKKEYTKFGPFDNTTSLPDPTESWNECHPANSTNGSTPYAIVNGIVWECVYKGYNDGSGYYEWRNKEVDERTYFTVKNSGGHTVQLKSGDKIAIVSHISGTGDASIRIITSLFKFSWKAIGKATEIECFKPVSVLNTLLSRISGDSLNVRGQISDYDNRLKDTWIFATESARGLKEPKLYTSFSEFCDWMETVFGYVYYLGEPQESSFSSILYVGGYSNNKVTNTVDPSLYYHGTVDQERIIYYSQTGKFYYRAPNTSQLYSQWDGYSSYNNPTTGLARENVLFRIPSFGEGLYYFKPTSGLPCYPEFFPGTEESMDKDFQKVYFVHRSELFKINSTTYIGTSKEVKYDIDSSLIYSTVKIGYDKKDYNSLNGRDEFNFNNTYNTGCSLTDKTLQLLSKYRADSYGIEFAVQKQSESTTDTSSDNDVFFVLAKLQEYKDDEGNKFEALVADRSVKVSGTLNDNIFNAAFSPIACVKANKDYIALQSNRLTLKFASSEGNSSVSIDGTPLSADIPIVGSMLTNGVLEFTTDDTDTPNSTDRLYVVYNGGVTYRGYLKSVDIKYTKKEAIKYKLLVKDITK